MPIPEAQRRTIQVKLRLPRDVVAALRELARKRGLTVSALVAALLSASK